MRIEHFEERALLSITGPELVRVFSDAWAPSPTDAILDGQVLNVAPRELLLRFNEDQVLDRTRVSLNDPSGPPSIQLVRSTSGAFGDGDDQIVQLGWIGGGVTAQGQPIADRPNEVILRFAEALPDDLYQLVIVGSSGYVGPDGVPVPRLVNTDGLPFHNGANLKFNFELDLGAQVIAVVPQPVTRDAVGDLQQDRDKITVYFNDDALDPVLANDPRFYLLFDTNDTLRTDDDTILLPAGVTYDDVTNTAVLDFGADLPLATYRLQIGSSDESNATEATAIRVGTVFDTTDYAHVAFIGDEGGADDVDLYEVQLEAGATISVTVRPGAGLDTAIRLFNDANAPLAMGGFSNGAGVQDTLAFIPGLAGTYYIGVSHTGNVAYGTDGTNPGGGTATGSYAITITSNTAIGRSDLNSSFDTATLLGTLGTAEQRFRRQIEPQTWIQMPQYPGGSDEPGHRDIPAEDHGQGVGTTTSAPSSIGRIGYYFPLTYGVDPQGNILYNQINDDQKERTREIFEMYASLFGFEVYEGGGIAVVTGDIRAVDATLPPTIPAICGISLVIMNAMFYGDPANDVFGGGWMGVALHEIGHAIGLGHSYDLRSVMGNGTHGEDTYPGQVDIIHAQRIHRPDATDIDMYQFTVSEAGVFTAETIAERLSAPDNSSLLNSVLRLYRQEADGSRKLIAQNDDYFSNDSYIELALEPGTYFLGVSSTGNNDYDPTIPDSGFGGLSDGVYDLKLGLAPAARSSLLDATGTALDGDLDNQPGGTHEFFFRSGNTLFVDKTVITNLTQSLTSSAGNTTVRVVDVNPLRAAPGTIIKIDNEQMRVLSVNAATNTMTVERGYNGTTRTSHALGAPVRLAAENGSLAFPYGLISTALAAASPGDIVRIVGNGGADGDVLTVDDNRPYLVGLDTSGLPLEDGSQFQIPKDVVVQIDAGAIVKLYKAVIDAGTSDPLIDRSGGALQVLGSPDVHVLFTSYANDLIGGDTNGAGPAPMSRDWGGLVFRKDSDFQDGAATGYDPGIFLNYVNQAELSYGGGSVEVDSITSVYQTIHIDTTRPTITNNLITNGAGAAISANPDAFDDSRGRIGPTIHGNRVVDNTLNGVFVRIATQFGEPIDRLSVTARFDDTDIVHVVTENLEMVGNPGGPLQTGGLLVARPSGRLRVDPGVVVKLSSSRIEAKRGNAHLIAEGTDDDPVIFTSLHDDRYGAGGTFDTSNNGTSVAPAKGNWGGLIFNANSRGSIDQALIAYAGGETPIAGGFANFSTIEIHHNAHVRLANSLLTNNDDLASGGNRDNRGSNDASLIFVRQAQPIILNNVFENNDGNVISINAGALLHHFQRDTGRSTGEIGIFDQFADNHGPLVRLNRMTNNGTGGMNVRAEVLTNESVWDDVDIVHVLRGEITVDQHHTYSGLRLQSAVDKSLVVKLSGATAGFTADGIPLDIDDRIGGTVQIVGQPGYPVILTSLADDSVAASLDPDGFPHFDTNNNGPSTGTPGQWRGLLFEKYSNDRNVRVVLEPESANNQGIDVNNTPLSASFLGELAPNQKSGDENRVLGFEVHGHISGDDPGDVDVYSFKALTGTEVWIDVDRTRGALDAVVELARSNGTVIASSTQGDVYPGDANANLAGSAAPLAKDAYNGGDYYTLNYHDPGFRVVLPGPAGQVGTYFVRVRSESPDLSVLDGGLTSGEYQLQIRLQQRDEKPGSTVRYADIRYATVGIDVRGLPAHSPLLGESDEITGDNNGPGGAQNLGNLLESDRNTFSVSGDLSSATDIDFYRFNIDYAWTQLGPTAIQALRGVNDGGKTWATVFDLDYSDGLTRGDTTMIVFDENLRPILIGRESNIQDDQPAPGQGNDLDDLTRGTVGKLDPFIGTVQLPTGTPAASGGTEYYVAVSANGRLIADLNQFYQAAAANTNIRLEPINSVARIIEDHIGFQGYRSNGVQVDPVKTAGLFTSISSAQALSTYVRKFDLSDVLLYVAQSDALTAVNPLFGQSIYTIDNDLTATNQEMRDIVMRSDGQLYGYQRLDNVNNTAGRLVMINHATGALTDAGNDNIPGETAPYVDGANSDMDDLTISDDVGALTFRRNGPTVTPYYEGFYSVFENERELDQDGYRNSKLYRFDASTGAIQNSANDTGYANIQYPGVTYATATLTVADNASPPTVTSIRVQAHAAGPYGDGIAVNLNWVTNATGATVTSVVGRTINVRVDDGASAQDVVDAINNHAQAKLLVQAARVTNNNATASGSAVGGTTAGGAGTPLVGNVTGLAFDSFTGGNLYGITNRGEFIQIDRFNGTATLYYDFVADPLGLGISNTNFQGLALGPQNLHNGLFSNTFFAINSAGTLVAFRPSGGSIVPVYAFGSDNETQFIRNTGSPLGTFTLTFASDRFGSFTTGPLAGNATAAQVRAALQSLSTPGGVPIVAAGDVLVTGTDVVSGLTIEFTGFYQDKNVAQLTVSNSGGAAVSVSTTAEGGDGVRNQYMVSTGISNPTGLAFSPVDVNLWHPTVRRGAADEPGHGINAPYDLSRTPSAEQRTHLDGNGTSNNSVYNQSEAQGGVSFYFGLEEYVDSDSSPYLNYEASRTQLGIRNNEVQRDLTSTATIGNNYDLPGGAYGSLITAPFDLVSATGVQTATDRPTLYFNYWLQTDGTNNGDSSSGEMKDSARVYISTDGGRTWNLLATNNTPKSYTTDTELPSFLSHSRFADASDSRQRIQELFETSNWRQARVDLSDFVGRRDLVLRFDFSTAGTIIDPDLTTRHADLRTPQDGFGDHQGDGAAGDFQRAQTNQYEGFYIDDIIIGWSERGEMITAASTGATGYFAVPTDPDPNAPKLIEQGPYQVEIRRGFEHAANTSATDPEISVAITLDPNVRLVPGANLGLQGVSDDFGTYTLGGPLPAFNASKGWQQIVTGSTTPWFVLPQILSGESGHGNVAHSAPYSYHGDILGTPVDVDVPLGHNQASILAITVATGTGNVTFDRKAITGSGDYFRFFVDEIGEHPAAYEYTNPSLSAAWQTISIPISAGVHTFFFVYAKDGSDAGFDPDAGYDPLARTGGTREGVMIDNVFFPAPGGMVIGDRNLERAQGAFHIENNFVRNSADMGIRVRAGTRESTSGIENDGPSSNNPTPGSPINFDTQNVQRFAPGAVIRNNVVAGFATAGIHFAGESDTSGGVPAAAVPVGKIINNTIYGGATPTGIGIRITDNASPIVLNNIVANTATGVSTAGAAAQTVIGRTFFHGNSSPGTIGNDAILDPAANPLFVDASRGNFYLDDGAEAIDRSLGSLPDIPFFVSVKTPLAIPNSDAFAPVSDLFGQRRVDDPGQPPSGLGNEVFYDLGAIERADTSQPYAVVIVPKDQGIIDDDADLNEVRVLDERMTEFVIWLLDDGVGIDDLSVLGTRVHIWRDLDESTFDFARFKATGNPPALVENSDYLFRYDEGRNTIALVPAEGFWSQGHTYTIILEDSIQDLAGNGLLPTGFPAPLAGLAVFKITLAAWDYGDAPDAPWNTYPSRFESDGARHMINTPYFLGSGVTQEDASLQNADASGDALDDGVRLESALWIGNQGSITVTASTDGGFLSAWIDFNGDGDWSDPGEEVFTGEPLAAGDNLLVVPVPDETVVGLNPGENEKFTFGRFRYSTQTGLAVTGFAIDGEVEDYRLRLVRFPEDFGDAPADDGAGVPWYPTLLAQAGASHYLDPAGPRLGANADAELDGQPDAAASGDDLSGDDDEDGVIVPAVLPSGRTSTIYVDMLTSPANGLLDAWIDFNQDGDWDDPGEQVFASQPLAAGIVNSLPLDVPAAAASGPTFARFRVSSAGGLSFDGPAADGEVEDYRVLIGTPPVADPNGPYAVAEGDNITLSAASSSDPDGAIVLYEWDLDYDGVTFDVDATGVTPNVAWPDDGVYLVALRVTDNDGIPDVNTTTATVSNKAPAVGADNAVVTVDEGQTAANTGTFFDVPGDTVTITASIGTVTQVGTQSGTWSWSFATTDGPDQTQVVTITASDEDGGVSTATFLLVVNNLAPAVAADNASVVVDEGQTAANTGTFSDPGDDVVAITASIGTVTQLGTQSGTWSWSFGTTDGLDESQTVTITATDSDGAVSTTTFSLAVNNLAPGVTVDNPAVTVDEGQTATNTGTFSDLGSDTVTITASVGSVTQVGTQSGTWSWSFVTTDGPAESQIVTITATDSDGAASTTTFALTVNNVPPTVDAGPDQSANEGQPVSFAGSFFDPGSSDTHTILWDFGDGGTASGTLAPTHLYADDGVYTVRLIVTDDDGGWDDDTLTVTVSNVPPGLTLDNPAVTVDEGQTATNSGTFFDPGADVVTIAASIGTVTQVGTQSGTWSWSFDTTDGLDESQTVTITATDSDGAVTTATFPLTVNNVAPALTVNSGSVTVDEAQTATNSGTFADPGADVVAITASIGTVTQVGARSGTWSWSFDTTDGPDQSQTVTITATDSDGATSTITFALVVNNVAPAVAADNASITVDEGQTAANTGAFADVGTDVVAITASIGTVTQVGARSGTWSWSFATTDGPAESQTVTITATDSDGAASTTAFALTVNNVPPTVDAGPDQSASEGQPVSFAGSFTDPGSDTYTILWDFGDGGTASGTLMPTHVYADDGVYTVTLTVIDDDGGVGTDTLIVTVANVPPTVTVANSSVTVGEGQMATNNGTFLDVGADAVTITASIGTVTQVGTQSGTWSWSFATTDGPDQSQTVTITATDSDGAVTTTSFALTVNNVPPIVTASNASVTVGESQTAANTGTFFDMGADVVAITASIGTVTQVGTKSGTWSWSFDTSDGPDQSQTVTITATDSDGATSTTTFALIVDNVPPSVAADNASITVDEGQTAANTGTFADMGADLVAISASIGTVTQLGTQSGTWSWSFAATDGPDQSQTVTITATDSDGAASSTTFSLNVTNVAPSVAADNASVTVDEGQTAANTGTFADMGDDLVAISASIGTVTQLGTQSGTWSWSFAATDGPTQSQIVTVTATDSDGAASTTTFALVVNNVPPGVDAGGPYLGNEGAAISFLGSFTNPGGADTHTILWDFGDGSTASGTLSPSHVYADSGVYTVTLTVTDDDGGVGVDTAIATVRNVAPSLTVTKPSVTVNEGQTATNSGTFSDPGLDVVAVSASVGTITQVGTQSGTWSWSFLSQNGPNDSQTVTITATDSDGDASSITFPLVVNNVAPTAEAGGPYFVDEGGSVTLNGSGSSDPGNDIVSYLWDLDGDGIFGETGSAATRGNETGVSPVFSSAGITAPSSRVVSLRVTDQSGATHTDTATVWIVKPLGQVDFVVLSGLNPSAGDLWYKLQTTRAGYLTLASLNPAAAVTLYAQPPTPLPPAGVQRLDQQVGAAQTYYFRLSGGASNVELRVANLVSRAGTKVTVNGTSGPDQFQFDSGAVRRITINGVPYQFTAAEATLFSLLGGAGDTALFNGTSQAETLELWPEIGSFKGSGYAVSLSGLRMVTAHGGGGDDKAKLHDSAGMDIFEAWPNSAMLTGPAGLSFTVDGFKQVYGYADAGGVDTAILHDKASTKDTLVAYPAYGTLGDAAVTFFQMATGFEKLIATATAGAGFDDLAKLYDGPGADLFEASPQEATMKFNASEENFAKAIGFKSVYGNATDAGIDTAILHDKAGSKDTFVGKPTNSTLSDTAASYLQAAVGFEKVHATATAGFDDVAKLYDGPGADLFEASPQQATMKFNASEQNFVRAAGFKLMYGYATGTGIDTAVLHDSPTSSDTFIGKPTYGKLNDAALSYFEYAGGFEKVSATATAGFDDLAKLYDGSGADLLEATPQDARLKFNGSEQNYIHAAGFKSMYAYATDAGIDTALLHDSPASPDTFVGKPGSATLSDNAASYVEAAVGFEKVTATATFAAGLSDVAKLYDSPGADVFDATPQAAKMRFNGSEENYVEAAGFKYMYGYASDPAAAIDIALLHDSPQSVDVFVGKPGYGKLNDAAGTYFQVASGFEKLVGTATPGFNDVANLSDSYGADTFEAWPDTATLTFEDKTFVQADRFRYVNASSWKGDGSFDKAILHDQSGAKDSFLATPTEAVLAGSGFSNKAYSFDDVTAIATLGDGDVASFVGSPDGYDYFEGNPSWASYLSYARMYNLGYSNQAIYFDEVHADAGSGLFDQAFLWDSAFADTLVVGGDRARLYRAVTPYLFDVVGFDYVWVSSPTQGDGDTVSATDRLFELVLDGWWENP